MLDELIEHLAWRVVSWYVRRRFHAVRGKLAIATGVGLLVGGWGYSARAGSACKPLRSSRR
jgi:hypothetical protein